MVPERGRYLFVSDTDTLHARGNASPKQGAPSMQWSASTSSASVPLKSSEGAIAWLSDSPGGG